jgi:hypothetical protein
MTMGMVNQGFHWGRRSANRRLGYATVLFGLVVPRLYFLVKNFDSVAARRSDELMRITVMGSLTELFWLGLYVVIALGFVEVLTKRFGEKAYY